MLRRIVFLTGTRADFGKLKPLINKIETSSPFESFVFVTGMHTLSKYGFTYEEVRKENYKKMFVFMNQTNTTEMDIILANTIVGFSNFVNEIEPDMIIVHGDRVEALAGAIVGSLNNILVAHIEGGELSGTIDELIRHAITKLSHVHFVSNKDARKRLIQMGETKDSIFVIGSPDIDIMLSETLPSIEETKRRYEIPFDNYAVLIYHPVTTELSNLKRDIAEVVDAAIESEENYVVVYPNNDKGSEIIIKEYERIVANKHFRIFPSIRFEYFLTLLKNAKFIMGNSSAGIREAEVYSTNSINIGSRQKNRTNNRNIINVENDKAGILKAIEKAHILKLSPQNTFGKGNSSKGFFNTLSEEKVWRTPLQKQFRDGS